jgi:hypothetical protein
MPQPEGQRRPLTAVFDARALDPTNCRCEAVTIDAAAPGGSERVGKPLSHAALLTTVMCLRHLSDRCDAVEARIAGNGQSDIDQRHAEAMQKQADMLKEIQIGKVEKLAAMHEHDKAEASNNLEPVEPATNPPEDDRPFGGLANSGGAVDNSAVVALIGVRGYWLPPSRAQKADEAQRSPARDDGGGHASNETQLFGAPAAPQKSL